MAMVKASAICRGLAVVMCASPLCNRFLGAPLAV
jgi:hypothetical protein